MSVVPATWEVEVGGSAQVKIRLYLKNKLKKSKDSGHGSWGPEFKPQYESHPPPPKKKNRQKLSVNVELYSFFQTIGLTKKDY
jgi:hypothetical protein